MAANPVMADTSTFVFSHDPAASKPVATQVREFGSVGSTAAFQLMLVTDGRSNTLASVRSLSGSNPVAVALTDATGAHVTTLPITGTVVASLPGGVAVTGSVLASQGGAPWSVVGSTTVTGSVAALVGGTVTASVAGQVSVTASIAGNIPVTQQGSPWGFTAGSVGFTVPQGAVVGSVVAAQGGAPWTALTSAWVANTPTVNVLQVSSPWIVLPGSSGATVLTVTSVVGHPTVIASIAGTLFVVASVPGGTGTSSVYASQVGSWGMLLYGGATGLPAGVSSYGGDGHLLRVDLVRGTLSAGADGAITDGADTTIKATVRSYGGGKPVAIALTDLAGSHYVTVPVTGFLVASVAGQVLVTASIAGTIPVQGTVTGSVWVANTPTVNVIQVTSPWTVLPGSSGATVLTVTSVVGLPTFTGSVWVSNTPAVTQAGAWVWTGSAAVQGQVAHDAVFAGNPLGIGALAYDTVQTSVTHVGCGDMVTAIADRMGRLRVAAETGTVAIAGAVTVVGSVSGTVVSSVVGFPTVIASIAGTLPITGTVTGSVWVANTPTVNVLQVSSPWIVLPGSSGATVLTVTSVIGQPTVTASVPGTVAIQGTVTGSVWLTNTPTVSVLQVSSPWVSIGSFTGTVVASVIGNPTVIASVTGQLTATVSVTGQVTVTASVIGNPTVIASCVGQQTVTASVIGNPTVVASVPGIVSIVGSVVIAQATGAFTFLKIAWETQSTVPFPYDGTGICRSVSGTTTVLASDVMSSDVSGLRLLIVSSGPAMGQSVAVTGWATQASQQVAHGAWTITPASGQSYVLLLDTSQKTNLQVRTEIASSSARLHYAFGLWAAVQSGNLGASTLFPQNVPRPAMDALQLVDALPTSFGIAVPSYWPGEVKQVTANGYIGAKVYVTSASARFSLWGGAF